MEVVSKTKEPVPQNFIPVLVQVDKPFSLLSFLFIIVHIPLGLLLHTNSDLSTIHAYSVLAVGLVACIVGRLDIAAAAAAYVTGAEVFWRMTHANIFWEYGKYASLAIFIAGIFRSGIRNSGLPFLYFGLLVPSAILTVEALPIDHAQRELSFNLSGPLALLGSACFFSGLKLNKHQLHRILIALLAPITGIAAIAIFVTFTATSIHFGDDSNSLTSGGYGPNQVSSALGLGALTSMLFLIAVKSGKLLKFILVVFGTVLISQCLLTFSRGGAYMAVSSMFVAALVLVRQPKKLLSFVLAVLMVGMVFGLFIFPWLNSFTGGILVERYRDRGTTGRSQIIQDDLRIWSENPILGVGPGQAAPLRRLFHRGAAAHTEYTRMLSEHGLLGLLSILVLFIIAIHNFRKASGEWKAVTASFLVWGLAYMVINAMRIVAPSFLIGFTSAQILEDEDEYVLTESEQEEVDT